jgi:site-specific DNA-methyltransferase (adenine-specific)
MINLSNIINTDCFDELPNIKTGSISLILIDPPYLISKPSNFHRYTDNATNDSIRKFSIISNDFGKWDKEEIDFDLLFKEFFRILKKGGTLVIFFDIWKSGYIKDIAEKNKFKQPRICCWVKKNPTPINSKHNYLSNSIEYFFTFVKGGKPTFNSEYDNGIYSYAICNGKEREEHPTQKPISLIKDIIKKHSNEGDLILDCFAGTGTTGIASYELNRKYIIIEKEEKYYNIIVKRFNKYI